MDELDPHTLRVAAGLVRSRIATLKLDTGMDGLDRLGAHRTLAQFAIDLEGSADHAPPAPPGSRRTAR